MPGQHEKEKGNRKDKHTDARNEILLIQLVCHV